MCSPRAARTIASGRVMAQTKIGISRYFARGGGVAREERIAGARGEDDDEALLELVDRAPADVRLRDLDDRERRLHARRHTERLELRLEREGVDDHGEHAHVVARRLLDAVLRDGRAAHDVAAADDDGDLRAEVVDLLDLVGEIPRVLRRDAELAIPEERLARELEKDPVVLHLRGQSHRRPAIS